MASYEMTFSFTECLSRLVVRARALKVRRGLRAAFGRYHVRIGTWQTRPCKLEACGKRQRCRVWELEDEAEALLPNERQICSSYLL